MNFTGEQIKDSYGALLSIGPSGATGTLQPVTDGFGTVLPFEVSTTTINFTGTVTGGPIGPTGADGTSGTSGSSGSSGTSGSSGSSGSSGVNGATGAQGITGGTGATGLGFTFKGNWVGGGFGTTFFQNEVWFYLGSSYVVNTTFTDNAGTPPPPGISQMSLMAQAGTNGTSGVNGAAGLSFTWRGPWVSGTFYFSRDAVEYLGTSYIYFTNSIFGTLTTPPSNLLGTQTNILAQAGATGATGASGVNGATGADGTSGSSGSSGTSGSSGSSGTSGSSGSSGTSGSSGSSGTSGSSGSSGTSGSSGSSGTSGSSGSSGVNGATGADGTSGSSGSSGVNGATGADGTSGSSGSSGSSGVNGATGDTGDTGATGATGDTGATGADGGTGATGLDTSIVPSDVKTDNYTFVLTDVNKMIIGASAAQLTFTIPDNATTAFITGSQILVARGLGLAIGGLEVTGAAGVTLYSAGLRKQLNEAYSGATLIKQDTDTWFMFGDLRP